MREIALIAGIGLLLYSLFAAALERVPLIGSWLNPLAVWTKPLLLAGVGLVALAFLPLPGVLIAVIIAGVLIYFIGV